MKPSLDQYDELGSELSFLCARLNRLSCQIGQQIGVSKDSYKHAREAARHLDKCKSVTEDLMFSHYPDLPADAVRIFYRPVDLDPYEVDLKSCRKYK